jgi:hypothetical protein
VNINFTMPMVTSAKMLVKIATTMLMAKFATQLLLSVLSLIKDLTPKSSLVEVNLKMNAETQRTT